MNYDYSLFIKVTFLQYIRFKIQWVTIIIINKKSKKIIHSYCTTTTCTKISCFCESHSTVCALGGLKWYYETVFLFSCGNQHNDKFRKVCLVAAMFSTLLCFVFRSHVWSNGHGDHALSYQRELLNSEQCTGLVQSAAQSGRPIRSSHMKKTSPRLEEGLRSLNDSPFSFPQMT